MSPWCQHRAVPRLRQYVHHVSPEPFLACQVHAGNPTSANSRIHHVQQYWSKHCPLPYSVTERRVPELNPVLGSQPAGDVSHKPNGRLPLLSARPAVTLATLKRGANNFDAWWTQARWTWTARIRLLPDSDFNPGPSAPESSTLTTRLTSHPNLLCRPSNVRTWYLPQNHKHMPLCNVVCEGPIYGHG